MDRLRSEMFGEFFADGDIADRLAITEPQRLKGAWTNQSAHVELHVGEGLEQILRTHAVHRSIAASMGSAASGAGSSLTSETPVMTVPSAFNDHSASGTP